MAECVTGLFQICSRVWSEKSVWTGWSCPWLFTIAIWYHMTWHDWHTLLTSQHAVLANETAPWVGAPPVFRLLDTTLQLHPPLLRWTSHAAWSTLSEGGEIHFGCPCDCFKIGCDNKPCRVHNIWGILHDRLSHTWQQCCTTNAYGSITRMIPAATRSQKQDKSRQRLVLGASCSKRRGKWLRYTYSYIKACFPKWSKINNENA